MAATSAEHERRLLKRGISASIMWGVYATCLILQRCASFKKHPENCDKHNSSTAAGTNINRVEVHEYRTGRPGRVLPQDWEQGPGAR